MPNPSQRIKHAAMGEPACSMSTPSTRQSSRLYLKAHSGSGSWPWPSLSDEEACSQYFPEHPHSLSTASWARASLSAATALSSRVVARQRSVVYWRSRNQKPARILNDRASVSNDEMVAGPDPSSRGGGKHTHRCQQIWGPRGLFYPSCSESVGGRCRRRSKAEDSVCRSLLVGRKN